MFSSQLRLRLLLLLAIACLIASATFAIGKQTDRESLRRQAEQVVLSADQRGQIFTELRKLVLDTTASADDRCMDFYRAINVLQRIDPGGAVKFAEEMQKESWPSTAAPEKSGMFKCGVAIAYLANRQNDRATAALKTITPAERASPQVDANRAHSLLLTAAATGNIGDATEARKSLMGAISNDRLSPRARSQYLVDVLRFLFDEGAPPSMIEGVVAQGERLWPSTEGEPADRLRVYLDIVKSQLDFGAPWPSSSDEADARVMRLGETAEKLRGRIEEFKKKYGPNDPATIIVAQGVATIDLELAPYAEDEHALEEEALKICNFLIKEASSVMIEPERVWFVKGVAAAMLGQYGEAKVAYEEVKKIHAAAGIDPRVGYRFSRRLLLLSLFGEKEPEFVANEWIAAVDAFATHVRGLALKDPDLALSSLDVWNPITTYGSMASHGRPRTFLEGYIQATGIVKNVPYRRKGANQADQGRLYGKVGLADVQKKLSAEHPMLVYVLFRDATPPYRSYYGGFYLNGKDVKYVDLGLSKTVDSAIVKWRKSMRPPVDGGVGDPAVTGKGVYDLLVKPLIPSKLPSSLYVVPAQGLEQVSFGALRTPGSRWVLQDCAVDYLGAIRDVTRSPLPGARKEPSALIQGDVYQDHVRLGEPTLSLKALKTLDASAESKDASQEGLLALQSPRYLHLSVHGDNRTVQQPLELADASWLVLPGPKGTTKDVVFTARQVATLHLEDTRCVLLAACGAAKSGVLSGEGIGGLRRSFYIAGARSVISSLLLVPETQASLTDRRANRPGEAPGDALLAGVYAPLAQGKSPAEALRIAQLKVLANPATASPIYWGGFICEGN